MELLAFYIVTVCALLALGAICFRQTLRALDMQRQIETLGRRADEYAAALLKLPDMGGVREIQFTDKARGVQAEMEAAALARMKRRAKPTAADFARHVPPELREALRSPRTPLDQGSGLRVSNAHMLPPGGDADTLHAAARSTPMPRRDDGTLPVMLASAGILMAAAATQAADTNPAGGACEAGGSVTTPGGFD